MLTDAITTLYFKSLAIRGSKFILITFLKSETWKAIVALLAKKYPDLEPVNKLMVHFVEACVLGMAPDGVDSTDSSPVPENSVRVVTI